MASLDDILTTQQNGVRAINGLNSNIPKQSGVSLSVEVSTDTSITPNNAWVARVSVLSVGSGSGTIYNANSVANATTGNRICLINNVVGIQDIFMPAPNGIVVSPSSGMIVVVSYS